MFQLPLQRLAIAFALVLCWEAVGRAAGLRVSPDKVELDRAESTQQIVVLFQAPTSPREIDVTRQVKYTVADPKIAAIDAEGLLTPLADGSTQIAVELAGNRVTCAVTVTGMQQPPPLSFEFDIEPILSKGRCNSGGCHGKAEGQNGFKLSLLGFDADFDHDALTRDGRNRRLVFNDPASSLLVRKGAAEVPHGGGRKIEKNSPGYRRLIRWISAGAPLHVDDEQPLQAIEVEPTELTLTPNESRQLRVTAVSTTGRRQCVTLEADFISNAPHVVEADGRGILRATDVPGEAAILVRYQGLVTTCRVALPRTGVSYPRPPEVNFIDKLVWNKLERLGIEPSPLVDDAGFLRRVYLDTIGTLPTSTEARQFLSDSTPNKRERLIDSLLTRSEYIDYWTMKWTDLLRADKIRITPQGTVGMSRWLRRQFAENRPYDEMVRDVILAQGPVQGESAAGFYKALEKPEVIARSFSQLFLGVRIECAQCHHHPSERWSQDDYAGLVGYFTGVSTKPLPEGGEAIVSRGGADAPHPRTNQPVPARPLGGIPGDFQGMADRREALARWAIAPENGYVARAISNRIWAHYLGRGLVEPIDDLRATNPATNEPLLDALSQHLKEQKFNLRALTKTILMSRVYQLSSESTASNQSDRQHFSHAFPKALPAEVLLDAVSQATGTVERFNGWPEGVRAVQVWDNRMPSYFFKIFGRPVRATVCECERSNEPSISQALHLMNAPEIHDKIAHRKGRARALTMTSLSPQEICEELCLSTLSRLPLPEEQALFDETFVVHSSDRRAAVEDVLWALLNTKEFLYNH